MSKPKLSIELADPDRVYRDGDTVTGIVRVEIDKDVMCSGLVIESVWRTHGRGNVNTGPGQSVTAFQGQWRAGERLEYPFELRVADWPPSYHGHYLNVDHYVDARAKIAWAFDPKASAAFVMRPTTPESHQSKSAMQINSVAAKSVIVIVVLSVLAGFMCAAVGVIVAIGWFATPLLLLPVGGIAFWVLRVWLPKYLLGNVVFNLVNSDVGAGDVLAGELVLKPRRSVQINGITVKAEGLEQVVSGSGSNQTTHRHPFFDHQETVREAGSLTAGAELRLPIRFKVPRDAPYSLDLPSNKLIWKLELRIDIPRWPDWVKRSVFSVVPSGEAATQSTPPISKPDDLAESTSGITFQETTNHLWQVRDDANQRDVLVDAVRGMTFSVSAIVERRLLYGGDHDVNPFPGGHSVWARAPDPGLPLVLFVPHDMGDEFEQLGRQQWSGVAKVVGWDTDHGRLQLALHR